MDVEPDEIEPAVPIAPIKTASMPPPPPPRTRAPDAPSDGGRFKAPPPVPMQPPPPPSRSSSVKPPPVPPPRATPHATPPAVPHAPPPATPAPSLQGGHRPPSSPTGKRAGPGETTMHGLLSELEDEVANVRAPSDLEIPVQVDDPFASVRIAPSEPVPPSEPDLERARMLAEACEAELAKNPASPRAARLHFELARLHESPLYDLRRAAAHYQEAYSRASEHLPTIRGMRRVLIARRNYQNALPLFDAEIRITADPRRKAALYHAKGRFLEDALGNREEARKVYTTAIELDRSATSILKAVEQAEFDAGAWDALARTYEKEATATGGDNRHRALLVVRRARLLEQKKKDQDAAIELYETALRLDPHASGALAALKRLHQTQRRWRDLIRVLEKEAQHTNDPIVRTMALYRVARLHRAELGNHHEAVTALERARETSPEDPMIAAELAELYEEVDRPDALVGVLDALAAQATDPAEKVDHLERIANLFETRLADHEAAIRYHEAALRIKPTYVPALQALGKLYREHSRWEPLIAMLTAEADAAEDITRRAAAHASIADICETSLGAADLAADHYGRALGQVPGYPPAFKGLTRLLSLGGRWRELIEVYERAVDQAKDPTRAITFLMKIGAVYEAELNEPAHAAHTYRRVLGLDPNHLGAIHELQQATERAGRFQELVDALVLESDKTKDSSVVAALLHRAGEVLDDKLGDRDGALAKFRKVLTIEPKYVPAVVSLGRLYYRAGRWDDLLDTYKRELDLTPNGPDAAAILHKMGELCELRIGRDDEALKHYRKAVELDGTHRPSVRALERLLEERGEHAELARVLEAELGGATEPHVRARIAYRIGETYEQRLAQSDKALQAYAQAQSALPTYRPATDALGRLRADRKAWDRLVDDLKHEAESARDPEIAIDALMRQGEIWSDELNEPKRAIHCYEQVVAQNPSHLGALVALETLYRRASAWAELGQVQHSLAHVYTEPETKATALRELARLQELHGQLVAGDPAETHRAVLTLVARDRASISALERIAIERHDRRMLLEVDQVLAVEADDKVTRAFHLVRMGESLEAEGADEEALDAFRTVLEFDPENLAATRGLSRIAEGSGDPTVIAEAARREARIATDGEASARLLVRSAALRIDKLDDREGARRDLERALELAPDNAEAASRLSDLLRKLREYAVLADLLSRAATSAKSSERVTTLWAEVGELQAQHLDNLPGALSSLTRVLRAAPNHIPALRKLAELYERDAQWTEAVSLLSRVVQLAPDRTVLRDAHLALATIWAERLNETPRALVSLQAVLALDPENTSALARLSDLQEHEGKTDYAIDTARKLLVVAKDDTVRAEGYLRLARLSDLRGDDRGAEQALLDAVALEGPGSESALELKVRLATPTGWDRYAKALFQHLERLTSQAEDTTAVHLELARVLHDQLGRPKEAVDLLRSAIASSKNPSTLRMDLATRLRANGDHAAAIDELRTMLREDLARTDVWREIVRNFEAMHRVAEARHALMPLAVLGAATSAEQRLLTERAREPLSSSPGSLAGDILLQLGPKGPSEDAAYSLLVALLEALPKMATVDLEAYGLSARDKVMTRHGHPQRNLADRIASIVGAGEFDLFVHRVRTRGVAVELGEPPIVLVPASIAELPIPQQIFLLARPIVAIARKVHPIEKLTPRELEVLMAAAARSISPGYGTGLTNEEDLEGQSKRIQKVLSRRGRKSVADLARAYTESPRLDFVRWVDDLTKITQRIAGILSDDLGACVEVIQRRDRDLSGLSGREVVARSREASDLTRFWVSEAALLLRQRLGMLTPVGPPPRG
jgi:tetratricopeptide (TPR) repeat protein